MCRLVFVFFLLVTRPPPKSPLFPYTTLFRSRGPTGRDEPGDRRAAGELRLPARFARGGGRPAAGEHSGPCARSEEHTSELQSHSDLVCRLLLEKKKNEDTLRAVDIISLITTR